MKLTEQKNGSVLTVLVEGSIDTLTAPQLERCLEAEWNRITELILDFEKVDYISSAGLRVVLEADKHVGKTGKMSIKNANKDVREIFEVVGFDELLDIE